MTPVLIVVAVTILLFTVIAIAMMVKYTANQNLICPHCELEFTTDLFVIMGNSLLACPFCRRWVLVVKSFNSYVTKKLFA